MDETGVAIIFVMVGSVAALLPLVFVFVGIFLPPMVMKKRIAAWTEGKTNLQIWESLEQGSTKSWFQIRPASFLYETELATPMSPGQALHKVHTFFSSGWGRKVLSTDEQSVVFSMRYLPFLATDFGWIGAAWVYQTPAGTAVRLRFRSTYMWPVITIFLTFRLQMYVINRVLA